MLVDSTVRGALFREARARESFFEHVTGLRRIVNKGDRRFEDSGG
jgi:hypothetical protein